MLKTAEHVFREVPTQRRIHAYRHHENYARWFMAHVLCAPQRFGACPLLLVRRQLASDPLSIVVPQSKRRVVAVLRICTRHEPPAYFNEISSLAVSDAIPHGEKTWGVLD
jgi:hypothetical protein